MDFTFENYSTIVIGILASVVAGFIVLYITRKVSARNEQNPYLMLMGIKKSEKTFIVIPKRVVLDDCVKNKESHRAHVTFEDMLAANYVERTLTLAGLKDKNITIRSSKEFLENGVNESCNVAVICSPKANEVSCEAFTRITESCSIGISFEKYEGDDKWRILFDGAAITSPSYEEEETLIKAGKSPECGPLTDFAVIARMANPWNPNYSIIMLSGIRGIGTWGAARYLRDHYKELSKRSNNGNFIGIIKITYENYKMKNVELTAHFKRLP